MSTDNAPMLSQPRIDSAQGELSPMISGRGTKIIADARGAYLAGNLDALIGQMTPEQNRRFRAWVRDQAAALIRLMLAGFAPAEPSQHDALQAVHSMLSDPCKDSAVRVLNCFFEPSRDTDMIAAGETLTLRCEALEPIAALVVPYISLARANAQSSSERYLWALFAMAGRWLRERGNAPPYWWCSEQATRDQIQRRVQEWQIQAAWAILQGREPQFFEALP